MAQQIQLRRDTPANWTTIDPVLALGEIGVEVNEPTSQNKFKIGDGIKTWSELEYFTQGAPGPEGPKGDKGDQGDEGPPGAPGEVQNPPDDGIAYDRVFDQWVEAITVDDLAVTFFDETLDYLKDDLVAYEGAIYFAIDDHTAQPFSLTNWKPISAPVGRALNLSYRWNSATTGQVPAGGYGIDTGDAATATTVRMSSETRTGIPVNGFLDAIEAGDGLGFEEETGGAELNYYLTTGPGVLVAGTPDYYEFPVTLLSFIGLPEDNREGVVSVIYNPASRVPAGGTAQQVLTKVSADDYDMDWLDNTPNTLGDELVPAGADFDTLVPPSTSVRIYRITGVPSANGFPGAGVGDWLISYRYSATAGRQIGHNWNVGAGLLPLYYRDFVSGSWGEWLPLAGGGGGAAVTQGPTFPADPEVGDLHYLTVEVVGLYVWLDDGNSTQWVYTNDPDNLVGGDPITIVDDDFAAGYQVIGDILMQWGTTTVAVGGTIFTYPIAFKSQPALSGTPSRLNGTFGATSQTEVSFRGYQFDTDNRDSGGVTSWLAVGEAPDDMKLPKELQPVGGSGVQEFHDPTGVASWQIVGNKLECWGTISGGNPYTVPFPKTFARPPVVTATAEGSRNALFLWCVNAYSITETQFQAQAVVVENSGGVQDSGTPFFWHAIGEWDGVS